MGGIIIYNLTRQDAMMNASAVGTAAVVKGFLIKSLVGLFFMDQNMENVGGGIAAPSKSAVALIWLGCWLE